MGYSNEEELIKILESTYTEQHVDLFHPSFPEDQIAKWKPKDLTTVDKVNFEKVLRAGRAGKNKPELILSFRSAQTVCPFSTHSYQVSDDKPRKPTAVGLRPASTQEQDPRSVLSSLGIEVTVWSFYAR